MLNGKTGGSGENKILFNIDCNIERGNVKGVSSAKHSIDRCTIPESTNEYLVNANLYSDTGCPLRGDSPAAGQPAPLEGLTRYTYIYTHIYIYIYMYMCI